MRKVHWTSTFNCGGALARARVASLGIVVAFGVAGVANFGVFAPGIVHSRDSYCWSSEWDNFQGFYFTECLEVGTLVSPSISQNL